MKYLLEPQEYNDLVKSRQLLLALEKNETVVSLRSFYSGPSGIPKWEATIYNITDGFQILIEENQNLKDELASERMKERSVAPAIKDKNTQRLKVAVIVWVIIGAIIFSLTIAKANPIIAGLIMVAGWLVILYLYIKSRLKNETRR